MAILEEDSSLSSSQKHQSATVKMKELNLNFEPEMRIQKHLSNKSMGFKKKNSLFKEKIKCTYLSLIVLRRVEHIKYFELSCFC